MRQFLLMIALVLCAPSAFAGWYVGNGGDTIECRPSPDNNLNGVYALDYILTLSDRKGGDGLTAVASWQESSDRILKILTNKAPTLAQSFKDFAKLVYSKDYSQTRVWEEAPFGLTLLDDQRITSLLPDNCRSTDGKFQVTQAVIRQFEGFSGTDRGHYIYKYVPDLLKRLDAQSPLQLSFLMVHEWLWDLSNNVDRNRRINRLLHSREIEDMTEQELAAALKGMGLALPDKQADAFDDDLWQGYPVTREMFFDRFKNDTVMANLGQLSIDRREMDADCEENDKFCSPGWRKSYLPYPLDPNRSRFFLSPSWNFSSQKEFPLKIVSPELISASGSPLLPGMGEIECRFVENADPKDGNLECRFQRSGLIQPLFYLFTDELPQNRWPKMKATLTEECFRLLVRHTRTIDSIGPDHKSSETKQIVETAFTLRLRWRP